jgi:hypothetical protein
VETNDEEDSEGKTYSIYMPLAQEIYHRLINRVKDDTLYRTVTKFDLLTGERKVYVNGKLQSTTKVRGWK